MSTKAANGVITVSARILIVADDFTGANDSAVQFASRGAMAMTLLDAGAVNRCSAGLTSEFQVLSISTESRNLCAGDAAKAVTRIARDIMSAFFPDVLFKKIDSTLRGNIEAELMAFADLVLDHEEAPIILTPAFPDNGRTVRDGSIFVDGVPLASTYAGRDVLAPVKTSLVVDVFPTLRSQVGGLPCSVYESGEDALRDAIRRFLASGKRLLLPDASSQGHLEMLVRVAAPLFSRIIWAGSAGLAAALASHLVGERIAPVRQACAARKPSGTGRAHARELARGTLVLYGSLNPASVSQVEFARKHGVCGVVQAPANLDAGVTFETIMQSKGNVAVTSAGLIPAGIPGEAPRRIRSYFASIAMRAAMSGRFSSLVLCGGDISRAVLVALGASAVTIEDEILTGVVFARICDGAAAGTGVVTKAGGFGGEDALIRILDWLRPAGGH